MSLGISPTFECTGNLLERLPQLAAERNLRVEIVNNESGDVFADYCAFKSRFGRIVGHRNIGGPTPRVWLTYPRAYAFNPLLWPINFRLIRRIDR